ncbi:hypothetical protein JYU34_002614 [Plutella xylostella]|uniref:Uncharacterized protein n=1 Tax=Plutella xylostella TaxID=51655 RepID=A0ABQ7R2Q1_PLUXY|nr:hypothetical protein JYU34_002614 [Plutella xylostella]
MNELEHHSQRAVPCFVYLDRLNENRTDRAHLSAASAPGPPWDSPVFIQMYLTLDLELQFSQVAPVSSAQHHQPSEVSDPGRRRRRRGHVAETTRR